MRLAIATLGCKVNQYESNLIRDDLKTEYKITTFDSEADIYIINTCTVTHKADYQSRQLIRRALKRNKDAKVIATGCYAERGPDELKSLGVHAVIGNKEKNNMSDILDNLLRGNCISKGFEIDGVRCIAIFNNDRTRALLKVQDGCSYNCSYCIVPSVRGKSRSANPSDVLREVEELIKMGYREIVISGINLGSYGNDIEPKTDLTGLLKDILKIKGSFRIRLSSIEPHDITMGMINLMKTDEKLCRHLHIPLQSGDDEIINAMNRTYTVKYYKDLINTLVYEIPGIGIGTDVIVGFPIEEDRHFNNSLNLLRALPLSYFHIFSYSKRPGTPVSKIKNKVSDNEIKKRNDILRKLSEQKKIIFENNNLGQQLNVLVENKSDSHGNLSGLSDNYIRLSIRNSIDMVGEIVTINLSNDY